MNHREPEDFNQEIESHIGLEAERLEREQGLSRAEALAAARHRFGNPTRAAEDFYLERKPLWWENLRRDFVYGLRALRLNPAFTAAAVLTLAIGIGANSAIFSVVDQALLRPLPYPGADRIAALCARSTNGVGAISPATYLDFRAQSTTLEHLAAFREGALNIVLKDSAERVAGATVTPEFFQVLGVQPLLGRAFDPAHDSPGQPRAVILSYVLWQQLFAGNNGMIGEPLQVDGEMLTVAGVMPAGFAYPPGCNLWRPARFRVPENPLRPDADFSNSRDAHYFSVFARLKASVSIEQSLAEAEGIAARLRTRYGSGEEMAHAALIPLRDELFGDTRPALLMLLGAVSLLLLIACANVANILLARGATRQKEIAVRGALGASRGRLVCQFLTESVTLGIAGGALGILIGYLSLKPLHALLPSGSLPGVTLEMDGRVLAFTALLSVVCSILFGLIPAFQAAGLDLHGVLKDAGRGGTSSPRAKRARAALVISEIALAGVLLVGAGLLLRSFARLLETTQGFEPTRVMTLQLSLSAAQYPQPESRLRFVREVLERTKAIPGVAEAGVVSRLPLTPGRSTRGLDVKGRPETPGNGTAPDYISVSPGFFKDMGIHLLKGRVFTESDGPNSKPVIVINQALANSTWPGEDPIGQLVTVGGCGKEGDWCEVVGIVEDVKQHGLDSSGPATVYVPYARDSWPFMALAVRGSVDPASLASAMSAAIHSVDRSQPVYNVRTMSEVVEQSVSPWRSRMVLVVVFAMTALVLACVGIYGVMAYSVAQRTKEIGVRIALGASSSNVIAGVIRDALKLCLAGVLAGAILSWIVTRFVANLLYGVTPADPLTFMIVALVTIGTALLASLIPAWRATQVDPLTSLRGD